MGTLNTSQKCYTTSGKTYCIYGTSTYSGLSVGATSCSFTANGGYAKTKAFSLGNYKVTITTSATNYGGVSASATSPYDSSSAVLVGDRTFTYPRTDSDYTVYFTIRIQIPSGSHYACDFSNSVAFTIPALPKPKVKVKQNGTWTEGSISVKANGTWVDASKVWVKTNGTWVESS